MVLPPTGLLHGHNSSVCNASSILKVSAGFLPTFKLFTLTCCITLSGSTMNVARKATPSFCSRTPRASTRVPFGSAKFASGLNVNEFYKKISYITLSKKGVEKIGESATHLAEYEELYGHALSIRSRMRR